MERFFNSKWFVILLLAVIIFLLVRGLTSGTGSSRETAAGERKEEYWISPSLFVDAPEEGEDRQQLIYGEDLVANTSHYLGPHGSVAQITNGMNCQNCHLNGGRKPFGNNYGAVASTYPKFRDRSGGMESIGKRVNDCFERSLNGKALDSVSREMQAIVAYIKWLGKDVPKGEIPKGSGIITLPFLDRAADPVRGMAVFGEKCQSCHGSDGQGVKVQNSPFYTYPPLWGDNSYNDGAGLYRISRFAGYVKDNMPFSPEVNHFHPQLTNEEAWDVAAFVNSQPRPHKDAGSDWPDISKKPFDHPFGPYTDSFSEEQHKFGPFKPIVEGKKNH